MNKLSRYIKILLRIVSIFVMILFAFEVINDPVSSLTFILKVIFISIIGFLLCFVCVWVWSDKEIDKRDNR